MIIEINAENYEEIVLKSEKPVLLDFYATWCGPCKSLHPTMEKLAEEYAGKAIIAKVDEDSNVKITSDFGVITIPAVIVLQNGDRIGNRLIGVNSKNTYMEILNKLV
jgi:thioredoxin 1